MSNAKFYAEKGPGEDLDYRIDWAIEFSQSNPVDSVSTSDWALVTGMEAGIVIGTDSLTADTTTVWLSGGTDEELGQVQNTVVTTGGRTYVATIEVSIK